LQTKPTRLKTILTWSSFPWLLLLATIISLLPSLFASSVSLFGITVKSVLFVKGWFVVLGLLLALGLASEAVREVRSSVIEDKNRGIAFVTAAGYVASFLFSTYIEYCLILVLVEVQAPPPQKAITLSFMALSLMLGLSALALEVGLVHYAVTSARAQLQHRLWLSFSLTVVALTLAMLLLFSLGYLTVHLVRLKL